MRNKKIIALIILIFLFSIFIITYKFWLFLPARFLLVKDNINKADCIVVLSSDTYFRIKKAVELYNSGYAKNIVVTITPEREKELKEYYEFGYRIFGLKDISNKEIILKAFEYFNKDPKDIYFTEKEVTSTYDEAIAIKDFMLKNNFKSLILVTSTYHTKRALLVFKLVFNKTGIKIYNCTAENKLYNPLRWWEKERDVEKIIREYVAIIYNIFYHFILRKTKTSFDTF